MKETHDDTRSAPRHTTSRWWKALCIVIWSVLGVIALAAVVLAGATLYLTPSRLSSIVSTQASRYLDADVKVGDIRFTIWSSFPHFHIEADSIEIVSRRLRGIAPQVRDSLPADADFLASASNFRGSINVADLLERRISLHDVTLDSLRLNLVAYNDSINNYDIIPDSVSLSGEVPYCTANLITLTHPQLLTYYSAATGTVASARLDGATLRRMPGHRDEYRLSLEGDADLKVGHLHLLHDFPFRLGGMARVAFHPLRVRLSDYSVSLGNVTGNLNLSAQLGGEISLNNMTWHCRQFRLLQLLSYLPHSTFPVPEGLEADLPLSVSARLTSPWHPTSQQLPSMQIDLSVADGNMSYTVSDGHAYRLDRVSLAARLVFDGARPDSSYISLADLEVCGEGAELSASGRVTRITTVPHIEADVLCSSDLARAGRLQPLLPYRLKGDMTVETHIGCDFDQLADDPIGSLAAAGNASLRNVSVSVPGKSPVRLAACSADVRFGGSQPSHCAPLVTSAHTRLSGVTLDAGGCHVRAGSIYIDGTGSLPLGATAPAPVKLLTRLAATSFASDSDTLRLATRKATLMLSTPDIYHPLRSSSAALGLDCLSMTTPHVRVSLCDMNTRVSTRHDTSLRRVAAHKWPSADTEGLEGTRHTPLYLTASLPADLRKYLASNRLECDLTASGGRLLTLDFPTVNRLYDLDVSLRPDSLLVRRLSLRAAGTGMDMSGRLTGLHDFLLTDSSAPVPLRADVRLALDTVNINRLARIYEEGVAIAKGRAATIPEPSSTPVTPSDSVALMIPRNLTADIRATADETVYTDLHLYDLNALLKVAGGVAEVDSLRIGSDFGTAGMSLRYATRDIQNIGIDAALELDSIDVVRFFGNFHALLLMMPQMRNLSGYVSAQAGAHIDIFPDMYANVPSLTATVGVQGRELMVHQSRFIHRIVRMLLINTDEDLRIANMNVNASVHDNLLELYPFDFECHNYLLRMEGLNNFQGKLYYHIGVLKSPLHFPFGINIVGSYSHPLLRFGGPRFKPGQSVGITSRIATGKTFNLVKEMGYYLKEFVHKAAQSDTPRNVEAPDTLSM